MNFIYNMSSKAKLMLSFMLVLVINFAIVTTSIISLSHVQHVAERIDETLTTAFTRISNIQFAAADLNFKFAIGLNDVDPTYPFEQFLSDYPNSMRSMEQALAELKPDYLGTQEYREACLNMRSYAQEGLKQIQVEVVPLLSQNRNADALAIYLRDAFPHLARAQREATLVLSQQAAYSVNLSKIASSPAAIYINLALAFVAAVLSIALALMMSNYISANIKSQMHILDELANGNFRHQIDHARDDEFGQSKQTMRKMRDHLNEILNMTKNECRALQNEMRALQKVSSSLTTSSAGIQSQALTVAAASDEMVSTTADIARNCEAAAEGSNNCKEITANGLHKVQLAVDNIRQQAEHTKDNAAKIESLAKQANDIGSIVSTIDDIASQTNLLALNAAIEAARAGEAGRGFAVVADEVRALASRTSQSTQEISRMVRNIQEEAKVATDSINLSLQNMDTVANDAQVVVTILDEITEQVVGVNTQITQIATAAEQQTAATGEISAHMQSITQSTTDMAAATNQQYADMESAFNDLSALSKALEFFKTNDTGISTADTIAKHSA